jgi:ankyrin repeat protein
VAYEANIQDACNNLKVKKEVMRIRRILILFKGGETPFHLAAENGHAVVIAYIATLPHSDPIRAREKDGYTPLHIACERGHLGAVRVLVGLQADQHVEEKKGHSPYEVPSSSPFYYNSFYLFI